MNDSIIELPEELKKILDPTSDLYVQILGIVAPFCDILKSNDLYFFPEFTDHGIKHINSTLKYAENLIAEDTFQYLTPDEVGVLLLSVVLHDIGMHTNAEMFKNMIEGKYDNLANLFPNGKTWRELWEAFLYDSQYWGEERKKNIFGKSDYNIRIPNLSDLQGLTEYDKRLIGEFVRIHHCRIAHEVSINGYIGKGTIPFLCEDKDIDPDYIKIAGIVARSHGMDVRDTFDYLEELFGDLCTPLNNHAVYLMVLLRLADYLQIDSSRTSKTQLNINTLYSPYSQQEHKTHLSIKDVQFKNADKEKIVIQANPKDAQTYVKIERLTEDIQKEFDRSWAILGEVYTDYNYKLRYRRITTNISNEKYKSKLDYVPEQFGFRYNNDLFKLLIAPLYGDDPSYGVRELVQNAVDACRLCLNDLPTNGDPHVKVEIDSQKKLFTITDMGKGMNLYEIKNYFLNIGSSYSDNIDWKKARDKEQLYRTGRFGVGVLAVFLLGPEMTIITRKRNDKIGYMFTASLNDHFIQIEKAPNADYGTKIEIKCNEACIEFLKNKSKWYKWYVDSIPKVEYYLDGEEEINTFHLEEYKKLIHTSKLYGEIYWKSFDLYNYNIDSKVHLYCNGFHITKNSQKKKYSDYNGTNLGLVPMFGPIHIPSLLITDKYNTLPLNLQRNNIEANVKFDFEPELSKQMFMDMVCKLVTVKDYRYTYRYCNHFNGFSLRNAYTKCYYKENLKIIFATPFKDSVTLDFSMNDELTKTLEQYKCFIQYDDIKSIDLNFNSLVNDPNTVFAILDVSTSYVFIHSKSNSRAYQLFKGWRIYAQPNSKSEKLLQEMIVLGGAYFSLIKTEVLTKKPSIPKTYVDDLFEKYMGNDPVIPYDIEDRKKKFPLLFQDYSDIIEQYMK